MAAVASWADEVRDGDRPETYNWHVVEIKQFAQVIGDRRIARAERIEALKFLIHFVGDLHMPLHAYAPLNHPKGTWVQIGGITEKLHLWWDWGWWDLAFEDAFGTEPMQVADTMVAQITAEEQKEWMAGAPDDWANESFKLASDFVVAHDLIMAVRDSNHSQESPIVLPRSALEDEMKPIVVRRLKMAGVRLAWLLNEAFK